MSAIQRKFNLYASKIASARSAHTKRIFKAKIVDLSAKAINMGWKYPSRKLLVTNHGVNIYSRDPAPLVPGFDNDTTLKCYKLLDFVKTEKGDHVCVLKGNTPVIVNIENDGLLIKPTPDGQPTVLAGPNEIVDELRRFSDAKDGLKGHVDEIFEQTFDNPAETRDHPYLGNAVNAIFYTLETATECQDILNLVPPGQRAATLEQFYNENVASLRNLDIPEVTELVDSYLEIKNIATQMIDETALDTYIRNLQENNRQMVDAGNLDQINFIQVLTNTNNATIQYSMANNAENRAHQDEMEARINGRMEAMEERINTRMDERMEEMEERMDAMEERINTRMDERMEEMEERINNRMDQRMDEMNNRMDRLEETNQGILQRLEILIARDQTT